MLTKPRVFASPTVLALAVSVLCVTGASASCPPTTPCGPLTPPCGASTVCGSLPDGANFKIAVPPLYNWNRTLVVYSHGYVGEGICTGGSNDGTACRDDSACTGGGTCMLFLGNPPLDINFDATDNDPSGPVAEWLLCHGYALAGTDYGPTAGIGYAVEQALQDQIDVIDAFACTVAPSTRTIAFGHSMGGLITAGLVQLHPDRFDGAMPMCGDLAGGTALFNAALDAAFVVKTFLSPSLEIANITDPWGAFNQGLTDLTAAQNSPQGKARIALAATMAHIPGWFDPLSPTSGPFCLLDQDPPQNPSAKPKSWEFADQELAQFNWLAGPFAFIGLPTFARGDLEARAGGNPSWNTGVDYAAQLAKSPTFKEVVSLYKMSGLNLQEDLTTLAAAPRIPADPGAVAYLNTYITLNGHLGGVPVLTMHNVGDGIAVPENENAYASAVRAAGDRKLLRQLYVQRAGHCCFTPAETIAAFQALVQRIDSGRWSHLGTGSLNRQASALGLPGPSDFVRFRPRVLPRP